MTTDRKRLSPEMLVAAAISSVRMEGLPVTTDMRDRLWRYASGEITGAEAKAEIMARYAQPNPRANEAG